MITVFVITLFLLAIMIVLAVHSACVYKKAWDLNPQLLDAADLKNQIANLHDEKSTLQNSIDELRGKKSEAEDIIGKADEAREFLSNHEADIAKKKALLEEEDAALKDIEEKINKKKKDLGNLSQQVTDLDRDIGSKTLEKENLDKDIQSKKEEADSLDSRIRTKRQELSKLDEDNTRLRRERDILVSETADLESKKTELDRIKKKINELQAEKDELESDIEELKKNHDKYVKEQKTLEDILSQIEEKKKELDGLINDIGKARQTLGDFEGRAKAAQDAIVEGTQRLKDIEDKYNAINGKFKEIKAQLTEQEQSEELKKKMEGEIWRDLDRAIHTEHTKPSKKKVSEAELLEEFSKNLKKNNIVFNERTINAFHTGLKAADASPLVVLSGISGTGKSLLPQLYAKAMGMNFLSVAVQPRWDSPQDMFGFFNYMQSKFKATELSRLLWQYDIYNNTEGDNSAKAIYSNANNLPMNIVLFDEMNLARVEYYFSDMLSKLEMRRLISDPSVDSSRIPAEVEIEGGSISMASNARRLFVNRNTLFVGTMNEDETTQSLSDKVMDRSNVLRFGKPEKLAVEPTVTKFMDLYNSNSEYLSLETWNEITNSNKLGAEKEDKIDNIMERLNVIMNGIDRPFAYRVSNAVHSYVNAYPNADKSDRAFSNALADQIEMKVLPKLNGLDTTEKKNSTALNSILAIVKSVGDDELSEALSSNIDRKEVFFKWRGIVR